MIKKSRLKKRLTQEKLANKLNVSQSYISRFENKSLNNINVHFFLNIASILDLDCSELIRWFITR